MTESIPLRSLFQMAHAKRLKPTPMGYFFAVPIGYTPLAHVYHAASSVWASARQQARRASSYSRSSMSQALYPARYSSPSYCREIPSCSPMSITMDRYSSAWRLMDLHIGEYHRQEAMRLESSNRLTLRCPSRSMARMVPWSGSMTSFRHHRMPRTLTACSRNYLVEA